jgi:hypothetical protein
MDWQSMGVRLAPILTLLFGLGMVVSILSLYRMRRTARSTSFGYVREQSINLAKRLIIFAVVLFVLAGASGTLWMVSIQKPDLLPTAVPTETPTLIPSPTPRTPTVTPSPTSTPTVTPTPTSTPIPPDAELPSVIRTPFPVGAVDPSPEAALVDLVLAAGEEGNQPINATTEFPSGTERVYAFFTFDGMTRNVPWSHVWYGEVDGRMVELWPQVELWSYDSPWGSTWRYFNCRDGRYELYVFVGRELQQKVPFTVGVE